MIRDLVKLVIVWVLLFAIAGGEFLVSGIQMPQVYRPVLLLFAVVMVVIIAFFFMHLNRMPTVAKGFAVAGVFWLIVLFGIGMMDPLTRNFWWVQFYNPL